MRYYTAPLLFAAVCVLDGCSASDTQPSGPQHPLVGTPAPLESAGNQAGVRLADCVAEHVARTGRRAADLTELSCPSADCPDGPDPDLSSLAGLSKLVSLDLSGRCISRLDALAGLKSLRSLKLSRNAIADVRPLTGLSRLSALDLSVNQLAEVSGLARLTALERLVLDRNQIRDIRPLGALTALKELSVAEAGVRDTWSHIDRAPFEQLSKLQKLDLHGNSFTRLPTFDDFMPELVELDVSGNDGYVVRSIASLSRLRKLNIANTLVDDLSPLARLTSLAELKADGPWNFVTTTAPLEALISRGVLRTVSIADNCVTDCGALAGSANNCAGSQYEPSVCARGRAGNSVPFSVAAVPIGSVERYARSDLPVWSKEQVARAQAELKKAIDWSEPESGCADRAGAGRDLLTQAQFPETTAVYAFGNLRPLTANFPTGFVSFDWHVALAVRAETTPGTTEFFVLDPALGEDPFPLSQWFARLTDSLGLTTGYDFSCETYRRESSGLGTICDDNGMLRVDDLRHLRGIICDDIGCITGRVLP